MAERSPQRAAEVIERASKRPSFRASLVDRRLFDKQMKTPGFNKNALPAYDVPAENLTSRGRAAVPLSQIQTSQPTVSVAKVQAKIASGLGTSLPQVVKRGEMYYVADGNHRLTAARALGHKTAMVHVLEMTAQRQVSQAITRQALSQAMAHASTSAMVAMTAGHAAVAYGQAKESGKGTGAAIVDGAVAGAATAAAPIGVAALAGAAMKSGVISKAAWLTAGKAAMPLAVAGTAAYYGWRAMQEGKGVTGVAANAAWGAVNAVIPVDLALEAYGVNRGSGSTATAQARPKALSPEQAAAFDSVEKSFKRAPQPAEDGTGQGGPRGYANPNTQRAAQEARGVVNFTDWAATAQPKKG